MYAVELAYIMATLRVRQILSNLNTDQKSALKKLLPPKVSVPDVATSKYPSALLSIFPEDEVGKYAHLGIFTEELLRLPSAEITLESLLESLRGYLSDCTDAVEAKIRKSVTTQPYLDCVMKTRQDLEKVLRSSAEEGELKYEEEIVFGSVAGHPDMWNKTQVFEVKTTGMLKDNWTSFLFQAFAYGALMPSVKDIYLVLPLQKLVWHYPMASWTKRTEFRDFLTSWSTTAQTDRVAAGLQAAVLCATHGIGCHIGKQKTLTDTIRSVAMSSAPYQIFLSGPQNSNIKTDDKDLASALALVEQTGARIFVHSQYLINLSNKDSTDLWHEKLLIKNLQVCKAFGGQGVVVHVGKSVKLGKQEAIDQMRASILRCLDHATAECPLLLETPAGQGTELLTDMKEFLDFVEGFATPKLRMCLDTCHVFAAGHDPKTYLETTLARPGLLKLVHYNDSLGECGSCKDRHAHISTGEGLIGFPKMSEIASICSAHDIPMIIE
jgi:deoxyribonuclease-4